jgi:Icc-related predicted phosphoesterase
MTARCKVVAFSDLHGFLPKVPPCDLCLIAGDVCPVTNHRLDFQEHWLKSRFDRWLAEISAERVIGIAGNHDFVFEHRPGVGELIRNWVYLEDSGTAFRGLKIWGSPWQPRFGDWAFNLDETELAQKWALIPDDTDILLLHGPPFEHGDLTVDGHHAGSTSLRARLEAIRPKLAVYGHIHEARGIHCPRADLPASEVWANVSIMNERYEPVHEPMVFDVELARTAVTGGENIVARPGKGVSSAVPRPPKAADVPPDRPR